MIAIRLLRIGIFITVLLAGLSLCACTTPAAMPLVQTATPVAVEATAAPEPAPTAEVTTAPTPESPAQSLAESARQVHGDRLISLINIPSLDIYAYVIPVGWELDISNADDTAWDSPDAMVGWAVSSALPGDDGNIILYGHNNIYSSVFQDLYQLEQGAEVVLTTGGREWRYRVADVILMPEDEEGSASVLVEYMKPTLAPRLTIISCYPPEDNTHRVIVIARPVDV